MSFDLLTMIDGDHLVVSERSSNVFYKINMKGQREFAYKDDGVCEQNHGMNISEFYKDYESGGISKDGMLEENFDSDNLGRDGGVGNQVIDESTKTIVDIGEDSEDENDQEEEEDSGGDNDAESDDNGNSSNQAENEVTVDFKGADITTPYSQTLQNNNNKSNKFDEQQVPADFPSMLLEDPGNSNNN